MNPKTVFIALLSTLLWLSWLDFPVPMRVNIDTSWQQFFGYAFKQHLQAGIDYSFTYGPLGYFHLKNPPYDAELFFMTIVGKVLICFWLAFIFLTQLTQFSSWKRQLLYLFLMVTIFPTFSDVSDPLYLFTIIGTTFLVIHPPKIINSPNRYFWFLHLGLLSLAIFSLAKITYFILTSLCLISLLIVVWHRQSLQKALLILGSLTVMFLGIWLLCQPSLWNLPVFISRALQIARYYNETMSLPPDENALQFAFGIISVMLLMIGLSYFTRPRTLTKGIQGSLLVCALFIAWKATFVRYSPYAHASIFFIFALMLPLLIEPFSKKIVNHLLEGLSMVMVLGGLFYTVGSAYHYTPSLLLNVWSMKMKDKLSVLTSPEQTKATYDQKMLSLTSEYALPKFQRHVNHAPVDVFSPGIGRIFFNSFNYHPRPFFQGYVAYTQDFLHLNGQFYAHSQTSPSFIIFKVVPLDNRFPTMEDSQALRVLLRDYQPIDYEKNLWLLERRPRPPSPSHLLLTQEVALEEEINLQNFSHKTLLLSLDIQKSFWGQMMTFLFQLPPIFIEIQTTQGDKFAYRLVPSLSQLDFLINPLLIEPHDWFNWYLDLPLRKIATLKILTNGQQAFFQPTIKVKVSEDDRLVPYPLKQEFKQALHKNSLENF